MGAHYAGAIPVDLLGQEQGRISQSLASIQTELDATNEKWEVIERNFGRALAFATNCHAAYTSAPEHIRRMFNQVLFEEILVFGPDAEHVRVAPNFTPPFDILFDSEARTAVAQSRQMQSAHRNRRALCVCGA